ncbi:TRAP transporter substrate-binding protein DctP [Bacilliculturomica massiliensis]|uniref:TRAP transporter substrate-binding protein DctP n=1 Tax=Bacilliculturomica massiliensis TaxID=1917867 RepID=UPI0013EEFF07|nr:TRAP transporter substrate-binding protein DctP [Bacilliculturomica massiliensis]
MLKKGIALLIGLTLAVGLAGCGGDGGSAGGDGGSSKPVDLKLSTAVPDTSSWYAGAEYFAKTIEEKTDGKYTITIYGNDQLSGGNQVGSIEMLQQGVIDLHMQDALLWSSVEPKLAAPTFPWLMSSYDEVDKIMDGAGGEAMKELVSNSGAVCLGIGESGYRQIVNNKTQIKSPADLKGLKLRVPGIEMYVNLFKALGADPVSMNQSEVYTSLQQGALDGCENTLDLLVTQNTCEVVKNMTIWNYSYDPVIFSASEKLWDSLTDEEKTLFEETGKEAMVVQKEAARKAYDDCKAKLADYDLTVTELSADEIAAFKEAVKPIYEQYKDTIGEDLFAEFGYTF